MSFARRLRRPRRRGAILVLAAIFSVVMIGLVAFAVDIGYVVLVRTQLQVAADSSAMAAAASMGLPRDQMEAVARQYASYHKAGGKPIDLLSTDIEYGTWDATARRFTASTTPGNAIRVTARTNDRGGGTAPLFFARIFNQQSFNTSASAVAMANPRDIAFVVDLSGSMNNDTEPCWATDGINSTFGAQGYPTVGTTLMQQLYTDMGFGAFPGTLEFFGQSVGLTNDQYAYANLTKSGGPLSGGSIPSAYRIRNSDDEPTRKRKAYSAIIDYVIAARMPNARPVPNSTAAYAYWEQYLDYIIRPISVTGRGTIPVNHSGKTVRDFGNRYNTEFSNPGDPDDYLNMVGYRTYVQWMMDHGRDGRPGGYAVQLSTASPNCVRHSESTAGGTFSFPPREQPTHAARRSMIAAMQVVKERNSAITNPQQRDWVSVITFDLHGSGSPALLRPLTADYDQAMRACVDIQAVSDGAASTATESGLIAARDHIKPSSEGGQGRISSNKVIVLLTDGQPNLSSSSSSTISSYIASNPNADFYSTSWQNVSKNAALMQSSIAQGDKWSLFPVGIGLGTDYDFMDRMARMGATANQSGQSPRGSGNPAEYEQRLTDIFQQIITNPKVRLVQ